MSSQIQIQSVRVSNQVQIQIVLCRTESKPLALVTGPHLHRQTVSQII